MTQFVHDPGHLHAVYDTGQLFPIEGVFGLQELHFIVDACAGIQIALVALCISLEAPFVEVEEGSTDNMVVTV